MLQQNIQMTNFISQVKTLITSLVVKRDKAAKYYDNDLEIRKAADRYINTIDYGDNWDMYVRFDYDVMEAAGLDSNLLNWYYEDKSRIPRQLRQKVVDLQKQKVIDSYEEKNDYYRMLYGLPPMADIENKNYIYVPANEYGVPTNVPIHELDSESIAIIQATDILDRIIDANPTKGFLNYLGSNRISIYTARKANNFEILAIRNTQQIDELIIRDFEIMYAKARNYFMIAVYNSVYATNFEWYDEFIGFSILVMAVQRLISNIYKQGLTRDFYDLELIRYLFKSYSVPYIEEMDISYQINLAKNLNYLLQYKATDKVLYDVANLLGFYDIHIYKYYLVKSHRLDAENKPIFRYDESGKPLYDQMYNFHFQQVELTEDDINTALTDDRKQFDYNTITGEDPYWVEDDELKNKLYETNFNNIISKYMSLDIAYKIVEMVYEVAHTVRMVIDDQRDYKNIKISIPKISNNELNMFDLIIFLCAVGARKLNLNGNVPLKPYQIASVYGFNFKTNIQDIIDSIHNQEGDYSRVSPDLIQYMMNMRAFSLADVDRMYSNIKDLRTMITEYLFTTKDKESYYQYLHLYKSILLSEDVAELYKDTNGNIRDTYESLLENINPELYTLLLSMIDEEDRNKGIWDEYIDEIYLKLGSLSDAYKYLPTINKNESMFEFVLKLIRFFKSYTVDFVNSGIQYFLDDRYLMGLKLIDDLKMSDVDWKLNDNLFVKNNSYIDLLDKILSQISIKDTLNLRELIFPRANYWVKDREILYDKGLSINIGGSSGGLMLTDNLFKGSTYNDIINNIAKEISIKDNSNREHFLNDSVTIIVNE